MAEGNGKEGARFDGEGEIVLTDEKMRAIDSGEGCREVGGDVAVDKVRGEVALVLDGEAGNVAPDDSVKNEDWDEGCRKVGINPDFDPGFIF